MKIFLCAYFLISSMFAFAQTGGGFSNLYLYNGDRSTIFSDVVDSGDTLVAYGISYTSDFSPYTGVVLALFDTLGNHIGAFTQPPPPDELMLQFYDNDLIILNNGSYACTGIMFGTQRAFLSIFNPDGGLHFTKNYDVEDIFTIFPQRLIEMDGGGFLMGGFVQKFDYSGDVFLKRIDATGNEVWSRTYGEVLKDDLLQSLVKIEGNLVVVGGGQNSGQGTPIESTWTKSWIFAIDKLGLKKWEWFSPINEEVFVIGLQQTHDKGWIYVSATHQIVSPEATANQIKVVRRDSSFNLLWERKLSQLGPSTNRIGGLAPTPDGNWLVTGTWAFKTGPGQYDRTFYNCLYKLNDQGDTLWGVRLKAPLGYEGVASPGGLAVLPSGSVVWALRFDRYEPLPGQSFGWLIKVDNDGCVETLCQTSSGTEAPLPIIQSLLVYPNPARDEVNFELPTVGSSAQIRIFDLSGHLVWAQEIQHKAVWQTEGQPAGLYFYSITIAGEKPQSGKISVIR
jgi:hypothetical protein